MTAFYLPCLNIKSEARFFKITFTDDQILKIPKALDINKAHNQNAEII